MARPVFQDTNFGGLLLGLAQGFIAQRQQQEQLQLQRDQLDAQVKHQSRNFELQAKELDLRQKNMELENQLATRRVQVAEAQQAQSDAFAPLRAEQMGAETELARARAGQIRTETSQLQRVLSGQVMPEAMTADDLQELQGDVTRRAMDEVDATRDAEFAELASQSGIPYRSRKAFLQAFQAPTSLFDLPNDDRPKLEAFLRDNPRASELLNPVAPDEARKEWAERTPGGEAILGMITQNPAAQSAAVKTDAVLGALTDKAASWKTSLDGARAGELGMLENHVARSLKMFDVSAPERRMELYLEVDRQLEAEGLDQAARERLFQRIETRITNQLGQ